MLILVLLVAVLFIITLNGENANALNYRKAIQNQYASWEQELTEREKAVKEKEQEVQIEDDKEAATNIGSSRGYSGRNIIEIT